MKYDPQTTALSKILASELPLLLLFPPEVTRTLIDLLLIKSDIKLYNDSALYTIDRDNLWMVTDENEVQVLEGRVLHEEDGSLIPDWDTAERAVVRFGKTTLIYIPVVTIDQLTDVYHSGPALQFGETLQNYSINTLMNNSCKD